MFLSKKLFMIATDFINFIYKRDKKKREKKRKKERCYGILFYNLQD